jgi:hypothetical protein
MLIYEYFLVKNINSNDLYFQNLYLQNTQPIIRYAFDTQPNSNPELMGVDLKHSAHNRPFAVPFFQYLDRSVQNIAMNPTPGMLEIRTVIDTVCSLYNRNI